MNFIQDMAMKQAKEQVTALLPNELENKGNKESENVDVADEMMSKRKTSKKRKKKKIDKTLAARMFSVLLFHTSIITILTIFIHCSQAKDVPEEAKNYLLFIFLGCLIAGIVLSVIVVYVKVISKLYLNYILYFVLLAMNGVAFSSAGYKIAFPEVTSMLVIFDAGSLFILLFSCLVKESPSSFWSVISCGCGCLLGFMVVLKIFKESSFFVTIFGIYAIAIMEYVTNNALESYENNEESDSSIPSMMCLPFELNLSSVKIIVATFLLIKDLCTPCFCKKRRR